MLNALRLRWIGHHADSITGGPFTVVLNALRLRWIGHYFGGDWGEKGYACAQRLAASLDWSPA